MWGWLGDIVETVDNYVTAILSEPELWWGAAETAGSLMVMGAGGELVIAGGALCIATLIGCVIGVPAATGGVGLVGTGAFGVKDGIGRIDSGMNKALSEAESKSSSGAQSGGDLGPTWKAQEPSSICGSNGCEDVAVGIQEKIGGERMRITDQYGAPTLGKYRGEDTNWAHHDVVLKDGQVYDAWTGRRGEPVERYLSHWEYGEYLQMKPSPYQP